MAVNRPSTKTIISTTQWGIPITDAVNANTTQVATNTTAIATASYTLSPPSWATGVTVGNGTNQGWLCRIGNIVIYNWKFTLGSSSAITGDTSINLPIPAIVHTGGTGHCVNPAGRFVLYLVGLGTTTCLVRLLDVAATYGREGVISATNPGAWVSGNYLTGTLNYIAA